MLLQQSDWDELKNKLANERLKNICDLASETQIRLNILENISGRGMFPPRAQIVDIDNLIETLVREFTDFSNMLEQNEQQKVFDEIKNLRTRMESDWRELRKPGIKAEHIPFFLKHYENFLYNIVYPTLKHIVKMSEKYQIENIANEFKNRIVVEFKREENENKF